MPNVVSMARDGFCVSMQDWTGQQHDDDDSTEPWVPLSDKQLAC